MGLSLPLSYWPGHTLKSHHQAAPPTWPWISPSAQHEMAKMYFRIIFHELRKVFQSHKAHFENFMVYLVGIYMDKKILTPDIKEWEGPYTYQT
jgi:hypothetical protein